MSMDHFIKTYNNDMQQHFSSSRMAERPRYCEGCKKPWDWITSDHAQRIRPWKLLEEFPTIGCKREICPKCRKSAKRTKNKALI